MLKFGRVGHLNGNSFLAGISRLSLFCFSKKVTKKRAERQKSSFSSHANPSHFAGKERFTLAFDAPRAALSERVWIKQNGLLYYQPITNNPQQIGLGRNGVKNFFMCEGKRKTGCPVALVNQDLLKTAVPGISCEGKRNLAIYS